MFPIFEQGHGNGIGHGLESFLARFDAICREHQQAGRAKAFAFIFYDFNNEDFRRILKNEGVFAQLDRLSGTRLSIFYLHTGTDEAVEKFNSAFLGKLGLADRAMPPCVVFFKLSKAGFTDIVAAQLDNTDVIHGFHELYGVIERYLESSSVGASTGTRFIKWTVSSAKFISVEGFRAVLRKALEYLPF